MVELGIQGVERAKTRDATIPEHAGAASPEIRSVALSTTFRHHAGFGGYDQILRYTRPDKVLGIDENGALPVRAKQKYQWLFEFDARRYVQKHPVDVVHVLYEDYFRFSPYLFREIPVVATFHQTAERLRKDVRYGNLRGRVNGFTHLFTTKRYAKLAAAIVLSASQKDVLAEAMPEERIHVIPHGVSVRLLQKLASSIQTGRVPGQILTVGQWMRDWGFYFRFAAYCREAHPNWTFMLVNRSLPDEYVRWAYESPNVTYQGSVPDDELVRLYCTSKVQFLPVKSMAANNALVESMALGCPTVITEVNHSDDVYGGPYLTFYKKNDMDDAARHLSEVVDRTAGAYESVSQMAVERAADFDWEHIAALTMDVYRDAVSTRR